MFLTIFTPTYNRALLLGRLFQSLIIQNESDFEWIIVDDGSLDNTKEMIKKFQINAPFKIKYIYQENSGKHIAFNMAIKEASGDYFLCVDSDDWLSSYSIKELRKEVQNLDDSIAGLISLKSLEDGTIIGGTFPSDVRYSSLYNLASIYHCGGDRTLLYRTNILKKYHFPVFKNEKFMTECVLYDQIDMKYEMKISNIVTMICEYQENGLSSNLRKIQISNPMGTALFYKQRLELAKGIKDKCIYKLRCDAFEYLSYTKNQNLQINILIKIVGWIVSRYYCFKAK